MRFSHIKSKSFIKLHHISELELSKLPDLCKLLENVCTARDFLLEVGGPADKSLAGFMVNIVLSETNRI